MQVWVLLLGIYAAPANAINWDGPWESGMFVADEKPLKSEEECQKKAKFMISKMHNEMLAPIRFKCVAFDQSLPKGAPR
jgi:hypothetical protein